MSREMAKATKRQLSPFFFEAKDNRLERKKGENAFGHVSGFFGLAPFLRYSAQKSFGRLIAVPCHDRLQ